MREARSPVAATPKTPWRFLAQRYDTDRDGAIEMDEYPRGEDAFERLDADGDGRLTREDFGGPTRMDTYISTMTLMRYFHADDDLLALGRDEVLARFREIDTDGNERLSERELEAEREARRAVRTPVPRMPPGVSAHHALRRVADEDADGQVTADELLAWFDERDPDGDGAWTPPKPSAGEKPRPRPGGAPVGEAAPDFTLRPPDGGAAVTLSSFAGRQPVALIFGSYT